MIKMIFILRNHTKMTIRYITFSLDPIVHLFGMYMIIRLIKTDNVL